MRALQKFYGLLGRLCLRLRLRLRLRAPCPHGTGIIPHAALWQGLRHSSVVPSPLVDTWAESFSKGQVGANGHVPVDRKVGGEKGVSFRFDQGKQQQPQQQQPQQRQQRQQQHHHPPIPQMSRAEAHTIAQNMSRDLMMSHAHTSASLAAQLQVQGGEEGGVVPAWWRSVV